MTFEQTLEDEFTFCSDTNRTSKKKDKNVIPTESGGQKHFHFANTGAGTVPTIAPAPVPAPAKTETLYPEDQLIKADACFTLANKERQDRTQLRQQDPEIRQQKDIPPMTEQKQSSQQSTDDLYNQAGNTGPVMRTRSKRRRKRPRGPSLSGNVGVKNRKPQHYDSTNEQRQMRWKMPTMNDQEDLNFLSSSVHSREAFSGKNNALICAASNVYSSSHNTEEESEYERSNGNRSDDELQKEQIFFDEAENTSGTIEEASCRSVPCLLRQREIGSFFCNQKARPRRLSKNAITMTANNENKKRWQNDMLLFGHQQSKNMQEKSKCQWRDYVVRKIPFTKLGTPSFDAVLAIERSGSYILSIGGRSQDNNNDARHENRADYNTNDTPALALRFYGMPSPSQISQQQHSIVSPLPTSLLENHREPLLGNNSSRRNSPLLHTIPLLTANTMGPENRRNYMLVASEGLSAPVTIPVQFLISCDWKIGVAFIRYSTASVANNISFTSLEYDNLGTILIFSLPHGHCNVKIEDGFIPITKQWAQKFQCRNVSIGGDGAFNMRNLLWKVNCIPHHRNQLSSPGATRPMSAGNRELEQKNNKHCTNEKFLLCDTILQFPGYILLNDEEDGYRLTWLIDKAWNQYDDACSLSIPVTTFNEDVPFDKDKEHFVQPRIPNIIVTDRDQQQRKQEDLEGLWEESFTDARTGQRMRTTRETNNSEQKTEGEWTIACHAYMNIQALLSDILSRRKNIRKKLGSFSKTDAQHNRTKSHQLKSSSPHFLFPDYYYNLISINCGGRIAEIVIAFKASHKIGCFGVVVRLDLFTQRYKEEKWVQNSYIEDKPSLRKWCNQFAINRRMEQCMIGPYCCSTQRNKHLSCIDGWGHLCKEFDFFIDRNESDDRDPNVWEPFLHKFNEYDQKQKQTNQYCAIPKAPKMIYFSSLFPDCDRITNHAVTSGKPVASLGCKESPIELVYG